MQKQTKKYDSNLTRELWLQKAVHAMEPLFLAKGYSIPAVRVSCGWPSSRGTGSKKVAIGECWDKSASSDKVAQIFISPRIRDEIDPCGVLATLVHEVVHAVVGNEAKHGKVFGKCARAVGLVGKLTSTSAGDELKEMMQGWVETIGEYPHATLNPTMRPTKKQTTRMVKCECPDCGYIARTSMKWIEDSGAPICPCNKQEMKYGAPAGDDGDEEGGDE